MHWKQISICLSSKSHREKKEGKVQKRNLKYIHFSFLPTCYTVTPGFSVTHSHSHSHSPPINSLKVPWSERLISIPLCIPVKWLRPDAQHICVRITYSAGGKPCLKCWGLKHHQHLGIHETWFLCSWSCLGTGDLEFSLSWSLSGRGILEKPFYHAEFVDVNDVSNLSAQKWQTRKRVSGHNNQVNFKILWPEFRLKVKSMG